MRRGQLRTLVVAPHPDDEVIGTGIWMHRNSGTPLFVVHITDGSPRDGEDARRLGFPTWEAYALARRRELDAALDLIPVPLANCYQLRVPDKETYLNLPEILEQLDHLVGKIRPHQILSPAYEGGHPDHDSAAFAVAAIIKVRRSLEHKEFALYHSGSEGEMVTGRFLNSALADEEVTVLSTQECELKQRMFNCFSSQTDILRKFEIGREKLRAPPAYNFAEAPHPGPLLYERWGWGVTGAEWREHVRRSLPTSISG